MKLAGPACGFILLHLLAVAPAAAQTPTIVEPSTTAQLATPAQPTPAPAQQIDSTAASNDSPCEQAGRQAERAHALPAGLLLAIGRVESGRWDVERGRVVPWPWAVDAAGDGTLLNSKEAAIAHTTAVRSAGTRNVDVGCYQINLVSHPSAFTDLQQAFDPVANADYAARFLADLHTHLGNWDDAVAAYHSAQPDLGTPYRQRVFANWSSDNQPVGIAQPGNAQPGNAQPGNAQPGNVQSGNIQPGKVPAGPLVVQFASGATIRIWTPGNTGTVADTLPITPLAAPLLPRVLTGSPSPR